MSFTCCNIKGYTVPTWALVSQHLSYKTTRIANLGKMKYQLSFLIVVYVCFSNRAALSIPAKTAESEFIFPANYNLSQCYYRGVLYNDGERIPQLQEDDACRIGCICQVFDGLAKVNCAQISCPVYFQLQVNRSPNCVYTRKLDECCPSLKCSEKDGTFKNPGATCIYNNQTFIEGQPIEVADPCKTCVCVPGFKGPDGPGCKQVHCLIEPPHLDCKPKKEERFCCPVDFDCPETK